MEHQHHDEDPQQRELLRVCRIGRAQGLKGDVNVFAFTDEPDYRFAPGSALCTADGDVEYTVERSRTHNGRWIVKFEGVDDRNASEAIAGIDLYGEADDPQDMLDEDAWYPKDLVGLEVRLAKGNGLGLPTGQVVGRIVDVLDGFQSLLKVRLANPVHDPETGEVTESTALVPFVDQIVPDIDLDEGYVTLDPPGGLIPGL
ncbi:ribosome maturation factor RimM [Bifidobacterium jacchi]|uniref:Ribosome maturation factor RimM n=1 Tax=Bifidobacterium jacchi TaxID=2490545 RepID=A0A5N5REU4_9BIFI|nr:ribosome maturation factor RimM [Bifidobacterium jacchi]KAB5605794.1 ribosome maturation factor RimM [Bifidobacterium jacchi]